MAQFAPELLLHRQFEEQARKTPGDVALHQGTESITFAELDVAANRIAAALQARGVAVGSAVGLHVERSIAWVAALLGVLKTNAAVMPLPPSYPVGRLRDILRAAALDLVIDGADTPLDRSLAAPTVTIETLSSIPNAPRDLAPGHADQAALILCSSGSTGVPKMVVRSHRSFQHRLRWTWERHPYAAGEVCVQKAHATTTHGIYELFEPLLRGTPVLVMPDADARNLETFWEVLRARGVSRLLIVPSALQSSIDMPGFEPPPLNVVVLMGEYVNPRLAERAARRFPASTKLYSIYGSTEASSTLVCDLRESFRPGEELPLGRPISRDVRALVLDPNLEPVAPGEAGRLHITGPALFTEYFRNPEQTASVLVESSSLGAGMYDTHDQVRYLQDGTLQFVGRTDDTVKIRGFRVELQEVERVLRGHPGVEQAAVVVDGAESGNASLHAFVTPVPADPATVYETLRGQLPAYMVPSTITGLDAFPLTARGKLDRIRLLDQRVPQRPHSTPGRALSDTERRVRELWTQTLGHDAVAPDSSFFEVGGTSLTVFALVDRLRTSFTLDRTQLPVESVYRFPTMEKLAAHIDRVLGGNAMEAAGGTPLLVTMRQGTDRDQAPLFVIASAGGTVGAYEKLARALQTPREIIGVRDPFIWGDRDLTEGFSHWVARYVDAIRERQPHGPYYLAAYSSAGSFGYEIARRLRAAGEEVAILVLIDPLALDRRNRWRYGWWALWATWARPSLRRAVRLAGWLRVPLHRLLGTRRPAPPMDDAAAAIEVFREIADAAIRDAGHLQSFAALLELNTGLPFALTDMDFAGVPPEEYLGVLQARIKQLMPDVDAATIQRIVIQYGCQVRAQHAYELQRYDGNVLLVEPATRYAGLASVHLRPYVKHLRARAIALSEPSERARAITERFGSIAAHYRSMRDDQFVRGLAVEIDRVLDPTRQSRQRSL